MLKNKLHFPLKFLPKYADKEVTGGFYMVTKEAFHKFLDSPLSEKDREIAHKLHMAETPLEKMDTLEFMTFVKVEWHHLNYLFPDLTDEKFDDLLRNHIMDI